MRARSIQRFSVMAILLTVLCFAFSSRYRQCQFNVMIKNANSKDIWEYVADFKKMCVPNPSTLDLKMTSDRERAQDCRYTVLNRGRLSYWPYWLNTVTATYVVTKSMPEITPQIYAIQSMQQTCFFGGIYCLLVYSDMKFLNNGEDTHYVENIFYQCPPFVANACQSELEHQRQNLSFNLAVLFNSRFNNINLHT